MVFCRESDATMSDFTLFEALRETIYAEVATLISQNETRPHFLIELFRELQMLSSDYLRQRALYSIQDLVTRHLTEEDVPAKQQEKTQVSCFSIKISVDLISEEYFKDFLDVFLFFEVEVTKTKYVCMKFLLKGHIGTGFANPIGFFPVW